MDDCKPWKRQNIHKLLIEYTAYNNEQIGKNESAIRPGGSEN